jgi:branched-chain amino acid transport system substrate-binding protein
MKKMRPLTRGIGGTLFLLVVGAMFLGALITDANAAAGAKKLQIGMIACLTGWFAVHDILDSNEALMAAQMINERGGINVKGEKYEVEVVIEDAKSTLDGVTAAANKLVFDKRLKLILGPAAFFAGASSPVTTPNKVLSILSFCTNQPGELDSTTPYTFMAYDATVGNTIATVAYVKKYYPAVKTMVVVHPDDGSVPYTAPIFKKALQDAGLTQVGDVIMYANEAQDLSPIAEKINARGADAVLLGNGIAPHAGSLIKGLRELGNTKPFFSGAIGCSLDVAIKMAGKEAVKNVVMLAITPNDTSNPPLLNDLSKRITTKYGPDTTMLGQSANSLWVLKQIIEAAQSFEPAAVKAKWEATDKVETFFGPGKVCGDQTYGIKHHVVAHPEPFEILKDGKVVSAGYSGEIFIP